MLENATGRVAFEVALAGGDVRAATEIAARTAGEEGEGLRAELELRAGRVPTSSRGLGALGACRIAWVKGDFEGAERELRAIEGANGDGDPSEALILRAGLARRRHDWKAAADWLSRAQSSAREPRPALALERLLQRINRPHLWIRDLDQFEALPWALGLSAPQTLWYPRSRKLAAALLEVDCSIGHFRGYFLTRAHDGNLSTLLGADDVRFRVAALRMGLRVADPQAVLAVFDQLASINPKSSLVPSYRAEILHWLGRHEEAGADCERAIAVDPSVRWAYLGLAQTRMWRGDLAGARAIVTKLRRRLPNLPTLPAVLGELALLEGRVEEARSYLVAAVRAHPTRLASWLILAKTELRMGNIAEGRRLVTAMRAAIPATWPPCAVGEDESALVETQLRALRGNRSSSFITLFPEGGAPLLIQGFAMPPSIAIP